MEIVQEFAVKKIYWMFREIAALRLIKRAIHAMTLAVERLMRTWARGSWLVGPWLMGSWLMGSWLVARGLWLIGENGRTPRNF